MLIKIPSYIYVCRTKGGSIIINTKSKENLVLNESTTVLLSQMDYDWKSEKQIIRSMHLFYNDVEFVELRNDCKAIINSLIEGNWLDKKEADCPESLTIELTKQCNENCIHCYIPPELKRKSRWLPISQIIKAIKEFEEWGGERINLTGGEIFAYPDIIELLEFLKTTKLTISLMSNLTLLKSEYIPILKGIPNLSIQTSLYSHTDDIHNTIVGNRQSFKNTINAILLLKENKIALNIVCVVMKENVQNILETINYIKHLGYEADIEINFMGSYNFDTSNLIHRLSIPEFRQFAIKLKEHYPEIFKKISKKNSFQDRSNNIEDFLDSNVCGTGKKCLYLNTEGDISPCSGLQNISLGSILNGSLHDAMESNMNAGIQSIINKKFPMCLNCEDWEYCSRCVALSYVESGELYKPQSYWCQLAHELRIVSEDNTYVN